MRESATTSEGMSERDCQRGREGKREIVREMERKYDQFTYLITYIKINSSIV